MGFEQVIFGPSMDTTVLVSTPLLASTGTTGLYYTASTANYSTGIAKQARYVAMDVVKRTNQQGEGERILGTLWMNSTATLDQRSKFELPDGTSPPILSLTQYPDDDGQHHAKIVFGYRQGNSQL